MHQINDFDEDFHEYLIHRMNNAQTNDEQISDEQIKINNLNKCFEFFIIKLTSAKTKKRIVERDE